VLTVNIPEQAKPILGLLGTMHDQDFEAISAALTGAPANLRAEKFMGQVKALVSGMRPEIADLVEIVANLSRSPRDVSVTIEELSKSVAALVFAQNPQYLAVLENRLISLLSIKSLKLYARASDVQHQYEDLFFGARIISDIRTVFEPDGTKPLGAMIVHNLKITHGQPDQSFRDEKFYALDDADLDILQEAIKRAREKAKSLEVIIDQAKLTYFPSK